MEFNYIKNEMIKAMKNKDNDRKNVLSSIIGDIKNVAIDKGCRDNIPDDIVNSVILKSLKTAKEQIDTCDPNRKDLLEKYNMNYNIINEYAPKMMSYDEVKEIISTKFADVISTKNKGMIMKSVMPEFKGKADGKIVNQVVAELMR